MIRSRCGHQNQNRYTLGALRQSAPQVVHYRLAGLVPAPMGEKGRVFSQRVGSWLAHIPSPPWCAVKDTYADGAEK